MEDTRQEVRGLRKQIAVINAIYVGMLFFEGDSLLHTALVDAAREFREPLLLLEFISAAGCLGGIVFVFGVQGLTCSFSSSPVGP
mmetsp:Transcript_42075/g.134408  ORF Transcript_42075/g.134408 Transcript_42075/m.134408 type:complete len:85 (+) Transcript_42075:56-310(+)